MAQQIKVQIKLRTDTENNWNTHPNTIIANKELIVVRYSDGTIGFKIGNGSTYANTPFVKLNDAIVSKISNGTYTYNLPSKNGTISLTSDLNDYVTRQEFEDTLGDLETIINGI